MEEFMGRHRHGIEGHTLMKKATVALLSRIELATAKSPVELEAEYGLGLRSEYELKTGQTWRRLADPARSDALHLDNYFRIASLALGKGILLFSDENYRLGLLGLKMRHLRLVDGNGWQANRDLKSTLDGEQQAVRIFSEGVDRMLRGRSPVPKGATGRGRPGVPSGAMEARSAYENWRATLAKLGAAVVEADNLTDIELYTAAANSMPPNATPSELARLRSDVLPHFDAAKLAGPKPLTATFIASVKRLRLVFHRSGSNVPLFPGPLGVAPGQCTLPEVHTDDATSLSEQDICNFFKALQGAMKAQASG
jgi:hypothetical protein